MYSQSEINLRQELMVFLCIKCIFDTNITINKNVLSVTLNKTKNMYYNCCVKMTYILFCRDIWVYHWPYIKEAKQVSYLKIIF